MSIMCCPKSTFHLTQFQIATLSDLSLHRYVYWNKLYVTPCQIVSFSYSCQLSSPSVDGLFALCSLGLVSGDVTLATAAVTELQKWQDKEEGETIAMDLGFLTAMMYALQVRSNSLY